MRKTNSDITKQPITPIMPLIFTIDKMLEKRQLSSVEVARKIGISPVNFSRLKTGKAKAIRTETLEKLCMVLKCKPADLVDYYPEPPKRSLGW